MRRKQIEEKMTQKQSSPPAEMKPAISLGYSGSLRDKRTALEQNINRSASGKWQFYNSSFLPWFQIIIFRPIDPAGIFVRWRPRRRFNPFPLGTTYVGKEDNDTATTCGLVIRRRGALYGQHSWPAKTW
jgi:hypothetical protein